MKAVLFILAIIVGFVGYNTDGGVSYTDMVANEFSAAINCVMDEKELDDFWIESVSFFGFELWNTQHYSCREQSRKIWPWNRGKKS